MIYVGIRPDARREVFNADATPVEATHGTRYNACIGPFRTLRGARFMALSGASNPHVATVADAERIAKRLEAEGHGGVWQL